MSENLEKQQVVIPRFGQGEQLLGEYDIEVENVVKGRGSLIVYANQQKYMLKEYTGSKEKLTVLAEVLQQLHKWDEKNEVIVPTKEGAMWVSEEGGSTYLLKTYLPGRECDVKSPLELLEGVRKLADLHIELQGIEISDATMFFLPEHDFFKEIYRHNRELRNVKNYVRKKKKANEFEEMFERAYPYFYEQAQEIEQEALELQDWGERKLQLCHGDYHYHNVYDCNHRSYLMHYEKMRWDSPVADLTKFVRKALEKNRWNAKLGMELLRAYERIHPLDEAMKKELYLRLAYPEKVWKIVNHYNNNKKAWASKRDGEKLKQLLAVEENRQEFLEILYNMLE